MVNKKIKFKNYMHKTYRERLQSFYILFVNNIFFSLTFLNFVIYLTYIDPKNQYGNSKFERFDFILVCE